MCASLTIIMLVILGPSLGLRILKISVEGNIIYTRRSIQRFIGGLLNDEVVIFATKNNDTSKAIIDDEFLEQNQSWHS